MKILAALVGLYWVGAAAAETVGPGRAQCGGAEAASGRTRYEVVVGPDGKKVYRIKSGFVICSKVPKPDVLYGLLNATINYEWETLKQDFLPRVLHSVEESPF